MLATAVLLIVLMLLLLYLGCRKPKDYPPGPKWWPVLGCALEVGRIRQQTGYLFKTCSVLCKKYGPVVGLKIGQDRIVVLNDYESIRAALTNEDFDGRPTGPLYEARTWGARRGLIVVDGHLWIEQRRFVLRHLREFGFGRTSMSTIIEDEAFHLVEHFKKLLRARTVHLHENGNTKIANLQNNNDSNCNNNDYSKVNDGQIYQLRSKKLGTKNGEHKFGNDAFLGGETNMQSNMPKSLTAADMYVKAEEYAEIRSLYQSGMIITMHDAFGVSVLNTLWRMMADKRYNTDDQELTHLQRILTKLLREIDMIGAPFSHFPVLRFLAPEWSGYQSFIRTHQELWKFLRNELKNHKNSFKPNSPRDLMDVYLTVLQSKDCSDTFSESQLLAICVDLFMAGSETTSKALGFCFLYLVLFPEVQKKAQEEIDRVLGRNRFPTLADKATMIYINAIVLESLRMFMGRTLNVPHRTVRDTQILGYRIPKDTMIIVNFNRILMDESWGDPEAFRPERFIDENGAINVPETFFPFSIGRHRCMGETLARSNIFVITAALLQAFTFSVVPGEPKPSTQDFVDGVTAGPKPYRVLVSLRP